ncbi:cyclin-T1-2-like isoform X2 [Zingiber officinale]|uniref:cyclin-T1-2-like isoform X2 n=1 Tax=Zingiber officinale TaxID=94328 RepID=UPI001C4AE0EC|nr:cyclin-T1-2-like isoform X2 [Zingiber officinale]
MGEPFGGSLDRGMVNGGSNTEDELHHMYRSSWYFNKEEIEKNSPSRKDGIDQMKESQLRMFYCSFLRDIGIKLRLPQVTTATAIVYCHRFYLHQSHAENDWQTVATACMFLASKVEETPCRLDKIVVIAYETMHKSDPSAAGRIREKATFQKQKDLVLIGERVLLSTIRFDFDVLHPYKPLLQALKKFGITQREVRQTAWNLVNDWLWTTFYVQYKPHYIAAGSLFLAAKLHNIKLPSERGYVWWHEFDIIPRQLEGAIQEMCQLLQCNRKSSVTSFGQPVQAPVAINEKQFSSSPDSVLRTTCISSKSSSQNSDADLNSHKHTDSDCHIQTNFSSSEKKKIYLECRTGPQCHKTGTDIPTAAAKHNGTSVDKQSMRKREHIQSTFGEIDKDRIQATIKRKREREVPVVEPSSKKQLCIH